MENLKINDLINLDFELNKTPILKPFDGSFVVADPSLLTPDKSHDKKWHMFFHTHLGIYHFISDDGISFTKVSKIVKDAMRPNINYIDGTYYLFFEKTRPVLLNLLNFIGLAKWESKINVIKSKDLINWYDEHTVIDQTKDYQLLKKGYSISNPFLIKVDNKYRLYYSSSLTYIEDCKFCEPTYISYAESSDIESNYVSIDKPIIKPDKNNPYLNLCSGCLKVYKLQDGYIGIQNGIYEKDGKSHSAIIMFSSLDGISFKFEKVLLEPSDNNGQTVWMKQFVYASHMVKSQNTIRLYFNARDISNPIKGRECIGYIEAKI